MKKAILIFSTLLIVFQWATAQDAKKGFKELKRGDFEEAEDIFAHLLRISKYNAAANFGLALLYSDSTYKDHDHFRAFEYVVTAEKYYDKMPVGDLNDVKKYMNWEIIDAEKKRIDDALFNYVKQQNSIELVEKYIEECSKSSHYREIFDVRVDIEYENAKQQNTAQAFELFIQKYPYAKQIDDAKLYRDKLAYEEAIKADDVDTYNKFIKQYPEHESILEIKKLRNAAAFKKAKEFNTIKAYNDFIQKYPDAQQISEAIALRDEMAFEKAKFVNTMEAYNDFLSKYPESKYIPQIKELTITKIRELKSIEACENVMKKFDDPKSVLEIYDLKSDLMGEKYAGKNRYPSESVLWAKVFDTNYRRDRATGIDINDNGEIIMCGYVKNKKSWHNDGQILKLDASGKTLWKKTFGDKLDDIFMSVCVNKQNEIFVAGHYQARGASNGKIWILKLNSKGNKVWEQVFNKSQAVSIAPTTDNGVVVAAYRANNDGSRDLIAMKLDNGGNKVWEQVFDGKGEARAIAVDNSDNVYLVGTRRAVRLSADGKKLWEKEYGDGYMAYSATTDKNQNLLVAGRFYDFREETGSEFWVRSISPSGSTKWNKTYDRVRKHDKVNSIVRMADDKIYLVGLTANTENDNDIWILQLNSSGNKVKEIMFGTNQNEREPHAGISNNGKLLIFGSKGYDDGTQADDFLIKIKP